jgi:hypothetical protein
MRGNDVRILIDPRKDRENVLRILHKLVDWIEGNGGAMCWSAPDKNQIWINESGDIALYRDRTYPIDSPADLEALKRLQRENAMMEELPF